MVRVIGLVGLLEAMCVQISVVHQNVQLLFVSVLRGEETLCIINHVP
jgi:hypothetical protein